MGATYRRGVMRTKLKFIAAGGCAVAAVIGLTSRWHAPSTRAYPTEAQPHSPNAVSRPTPAHNQAAAITQGAPPPSAPPTVPARPLAELKSAAEMNALVDGPLPEEEKLAALAAVVRHGSGPLAAEAAKRLCFVVKNGDWARHIGPLLEEPALPGEAADALLLNLHARPLEVALPAFARLASLPTHPRAAEARDVVTFHVKSAASAPPEDLAGLVADYMRRDWQTAR